MRSVNKTEPSERTLVDPDSHQAITSHRQFPTNNHLHTWPDVRILTVRVIHIALHSHTKSRFPEIVFIPRSAHTQTGKAPLSTAASDTPTGTPSAESAPTLPLAAPLPNFGVHLLTLEMEDEITAAKGRLMA